MAMAYKHHLFHINANYASKVPIITLKHNYFNAQNIENANFFENHILMVGMILSCAYKVTYDTLILAYNTHAKVIQFQTCLGIKYIRTLTMTESS
jgi:hypothetical protein